MTISQALGYAFVFAVFFSVGLLWTRKVFLAGVWSGLIVISSLLCNGMLKDEVVRHRVSSVILLVLIVSLALYSRRLRRY